MIIEWVERCDECKGTGLYSGMAERDGVAVVCHRCKGAGKVYQKREYQEFIKRERREDTTRVIQWNPGFCAGGIDGSIEWVGGMSYEDWDAGRLFETGMEMRARVCPAWWYQSVDYKLKPDWDECGWGSFSNCAHFGTKELCWKRWDSENKQ